MYENKATHLLPEEFAVDGIRMEVVIARDNYLWLIQKEEEEPDTIVALSPEEVEYIYNWYQNNKDTRIYLNKRKARLQWLDKLSDMTPEQLRAKLKEFLES